MKQRSVLAKKITDEATMVLKSATEAVTAAKIAVGRVTATRTPRVELAEEDSHSGTGSV